MRNTSRQTLEGRDFLAAELERRIRINPRYSLRAYARDLEMSPGEISEILNGKRKLTPKAIFKVSSKLGLSATETRKLLGVEAVESLGLENEIPASRDLSLDLFHVVSDWYCFAILNLFDTAGFRAEPAWIARRLGLTPAEAKFALERLERIGLLKRDGSRKLVPDADFVLSASGIPSEAIRKYHRTMLEKACTALETQPVPERDITGLGLALDPTDLPEIASDIRRFRDKIVAKYSRGKRTEVYQLEIALFRITEKGTLK